MPVRLRKLIGTVLIVVLVILYALIATTVASNRLGGSAWWVHLIFFAVSGIVWVIPAMFLIRWMEKPAGEKSDP